MTATISSIEFKNFKALQSYSVSLQHMNILVGPNNSGKSTIISAFRILMAGLRKARAKNPEYIKGYDYGYRISEESLPISTENVHTEYNTAESSIIFRLSNGNQLIIIFPTEGECLLIPKPMGRAVRSTKTFKEAFPIIVGAVPVLGPVEHNEALLAPETIQRDIATHRASRQFRNYWYHNPDGFDDFAYLLSTTWPGLEIKRPEVFSQNIDMFCTENRISRELYWAGFGFQVWCQLLTHINKSRSDGLLVIDEPEIYLHPDMQRQLVSILREIGPDIIIATHSSEIMGEADPSEILMIDKSKKSAQRLKNDKGVQEALNVMGSLHNITLTQLARNRRAVYFEDENDFKIIKKFAKRLCLTKTALGTEITPFKSGGFSTANEIKSFAKRIQEIAGQPIKIGAVYDRDYHCEAEIDSCRLELGKHLKLIHIHERKELENYLLVPVVIQKALEKSIDDNNRRSGIKPSPNIELVAALLEKITNPMENEVFAQYIAKKRKWNEHSPIDESTIVKQTKDWFDSKWENINTRLEIVPGKEVLSKLRTEVQAKYGVTLTDSRIINEFDAENIPLDLKSLLRKLEAFCPDV